MYFMKTKLILMTSLLTCLTLTQRVDASNPAAELITAFKKLDSLRGYRIIRTQEAPSQIKAQMAQNPQMAAMLGDMLKPQVVEFANPGGIQRFYSTIPSPGQNVPSYKTTTIDDGKVLAILMEYSSEKDRLLGENSGGQTTQSATGTIGDLAGIFENPFGALGGMLFGEIAKQQLLGSATSRVGKWTCTPTNENDDLSKLFSSARQLGKSMVKNEPTVQYEAKSGEMIQIIDVSLQTGLPLRTVINTKMEGMGEMKIIEDYYDFDALVKIEMPKC
jgi:hypothetical protein